MALRGIGVTDIPGTPLTPPVVAHGHEKRPSPKGGPLAVGLSVVLRCHVVHRARIGVGPVARFPVRIAVFLLAYGQLVCVCCCLNDRRKANPEGAYGKGGYG